MFDKAATKKYILTADGLEHKAMLLCWRWHTSTTTGLVESFIASSVTIRSYASISMCYEGCLLLRCVFYRADKRFEQRK